MFSALFSSLFPPFNKAFKGCFFQQKAHVAGIVYIIYAFGYLCDKNRQRMLFYRALFLHQYINNQHASLQSIPPFSSLFSPPLVWQRKHSCRRRLALKNYYRV